MKVMLLNGSPNRNGCTFTALSEVAAQLNREGIDTELVQMGNKQIHGCIGCGKCRELGHCVFGDDAVNETAEKLRTCDGLVIGSPVYYASPNGSLIAFLDRLFYSAGSSLQHKLGASIVSARRGGTTASLEVLDKYFTISQMPIVSSSYWNMVHGNTPEEVRQDKEGMQMMRLLGSNMAWLLKCIDAGKQAGIIPAFDEKRVWTNFIR